VTYQFGFITPIIGNLLGSWRSGSPFGSVCPPAGSFDGGHLALLVQFKKPCAPTPCAPPFWSSRLAKHLLPRVESPTTMKRWRSGLDFAFPGPVGPGTVES